jgi:hypothetical protein
MGQRMRQQLATLCVASSLAMIALGGSHLSSGFRLRTLSFSRPPPPRAIEGDVGDTGVVPLVVTVSMMCEE